MRSHLTDDNGWTTSHHYSSLDWFLTNQMNPILCVSHLRAMDWPVTSDHRPVALTMQGTLPIFKLRTSQPKFVKSAFPDLTNEVRMNAYRDSLNEWISLGEGVDLDPPARIALVTE